MPEIPDVLAGNVIESAWGNQIRDRTMMRYASQAALDASIPLPTAGDFAYLLDVDVAQIYDGAEWVPLIDASGDQTITGQVTIIGDQYVGDPTADAYRILALRRAGKVGRLETLGAGFTTFALNFVGAEAGNTLRIQVTNIDYMRFGNQGGIDIIRVQKPMRVEGHIGLDYQGTGLTGTNYALTFHHQGGTTPYGQIIQNQADMWLDPIDEIYIAAPTTSGGLDVRYNNVGGVALGGRLSTHGDGYPLRLASASSERFKHLYARALNKSDANHPLRLLDVALPTWRYAEGYLAEGDVREGEKWVGPTAEGMAAAYPFAAEPDGEGGWMSINKDVVLNGLLWLVQDLYRRIGAE